MKFLTGAADMQSFQRAYGAMPRSPLLETPIVYNKNLPSDMLVVLTNPLRVETSLTPEEFWLKFEVAEAFRGARAHLAALVRAAEQRLFGHQSAFTQNKFV